LQLRFCFPATRRKPINADGSISATQRRTAWGGHGLLKVSPGPPWSTLLRPAGGPPMKRPYGLTPYGRFRGGPPAGRRRVGHGRPWFNFKKSMATPCHTPMNATLPSDAIWCSPWFEPITSHNRLRESNQRPEPDNLREGSLMTSGRIPGGGRPRFCRFYAFNGSITFPLQRKVYAIFPPALATLLTTVPPSPISLMPLPLLPSCQSIPFAHLRR
jgi:hypothetical protein